MVMGQKEGKTARLTWLRKKKQKEHQQAMEKLEQLIKQSKVSIALDNDVFRLWAINNTRSNKAGQCKVRIGKVRAALRLVRARVL